MDEQRPPTPNDGRPVWEMVIEDMKARDHVGRARYGTPLQCGNGRDALQDAYEECLDLCVYLRQAIEERKAKDNG
jgi:cytidylate kinase